LDALVSDQRAEDVERQLSSSSQCRGGCGRGSAVPRPKRRLPRSMALADAECHHTSPGTLMRMSHAASAPALVTVLGAGAWGSTLAWLLANNGHRVRLWARDEAHVRELAATRANPRYVPGLRLPPTVLPTADLDEALSGEPVAFAAVPARALRSVLRAARRRPAAVVSCAKGVEPSSGERGEPDFKRLSQVVEEEMPGVPVAALSGPNLATEIAAGMPAATTVASLASGLARCVQDLLQQATFRVYT